MTNRVIDPFLELMNGLRAGMHREGMTFAEIMAFRKLMAVESDLLGAVVDGLADDGGRLEGASAHQARISDLTGNQEQSEEGTPLIGRS